VTALVPFIRFHETVRARVKAWLTVPLLAAGTITILIARFDHRVPS
jgi:hypothetical protein